MRTRHLAHLRAICLYLLLLLFVTAPFLGNAQKKRVQKSDSEKQIAIYSSTDFGNYMSKWWLLGPVPASHDTTVHAPDEESQRKLFDGEPIAVVDKVGGEAPSVKVNGKDVPWQFYSSPGRIINLDSIFKTDFAMAYASAIVNVDSSFNAILAVGSDDAVKIWHNEKLVHHNWTARGLTPDQDLITLRLLKGSNRILIAVQDISQGWGFTARILNKRALGDRLVTASGRGNIDEVNLLVANGADVGQRTDAGLSPLNAARLAGREDVIKLLLEKGAQEEPMPPSENLVDHLYGGTASKIAPGVVVLVSRDGRIIYKKAYGYSDLLKKEKVSTDSKFRIGSITKQFTAAAVLKLQEESKLNVTDKLSKYFPEFPRASEVSLHHLLTHTSGIHSYTGKPDFVAKVINPVTNDELLAYFKDDPYDFDPGDEARYNNSGYLLLGFIIEKVSGKSYAQYLKDNFFDPLGMSNTGTHSPLLNLKNEAKGHVNNNGKYEKAPDWNMTWAGGAGALYSTVDDLHKWNEALYNGKVLNDKSLATALTPVTLNNGQKPAGFEYGYGLGVGNYRDVKTVQHGGGLHGFISQLSWYPQDKLTVAILTNISPPEANLNANAIAEFYLWEKMASQSSYAEKKLNGQDLKAFEGRYDFGNGLVMIATTEGDQLFAQLTGQPRFPIFPSGHDEFFWKVVEAKIKFTRNNAGEVTGGQFSQGTNQITAVKMKDEKVVSLDPEIYKKYVGKYDYGNNFYITITIETNRIFVQGTNQPKFEIFPVSSTEFIVREANARIVFLDGPDGTVAKLNLDMGGQKKDAPKIE